MQEITNFRKYLNEGQLNEGSTTKFYAFNDDGDIEHGYMLQNITGKSEDEIEKHIKSRYFGTFIKPNMDEEAADELEEKIDNGTDDTIEIMVDMGIVAHEDPKFEEVSFKFYEYASNEE